MRSNQPRENRFSASSLIQIIRYMQQRVRWNQSGARTVAVGEAVVSTGDDGLDGGRRRGGGGRMVTSPSSTSPTIDKRFVEFVAKDCEVESKVTLW